MRFSDSGVTTARKQLRRLIDDGMSVLDAANVVRDRIVYNTPPQEDETLSTPRVSNRHGGRPNSKEPRRCKCGCGADITGRRWYATDECAARYRESRLKTPEPVPMGVTEVGD